MARDYRDSINKFIDLCDTTDLDDLISTFDNLHKLFIRARQNYDSKREREKLMAAMEPWFDPCHPLNHPSRIGAADGDGE